MTDRHGPIEIDTFTAPPFGENSYLVRCGASEQAVAIDPGGAAMHMADVLTRERLTLAAILLTHAHVDHIEGVGELVRRTGAAVHLHPGDRPLYDRVSEQAAYVGVSVPQPPPVDADLRDGQVFEFGACALEVRHAPGHSPGHVLLYAPAAGVAFVGDVVFAGSIGRSDLPGGDFRRLMQSIRERVLTLPDETVLYTGHGPPTTVAHERATNPFLVPQYGGGLA